MSDVTIFAPSPTLTVTVEDHPSGSEIHVHAGGQGVWQARMLRSLGCTVTMCSVLTGEIGTVLRHLIEDEDIEIVATDRAGRGSAYIHDRRDGKRVALVEEDGDALGRHELDDLYGHVLHSASESSIVILSGPAGENTIPADVYRRMATDLRASGARVVADLAGERLEAVLSGGVDIVKVSHEELRADGLTSDDSVDAIIAAMHEIRSRGAHSVIVTRAADPLLLLDDDGLLEITSPPFEENETRGAGDSLTAGVVAGLASGEPIRSAITLGAAAGALNVTRHGLGTGDAKAIAVVRDRVTTRELPSSAREATPGQGGAQPDTERVTPDGLAAMATQEDPA